MLTINLFGGLTVETDGRPLPKLISRKADMMLAYLAQAQQPTARETIATLLWEDRTQKQSMSNLRTLISSLRKHAGDFVTITRKTAVINQDVWVDTAVFQQQLALADENWPQKSAIAQAEEALALYRGEFLDGVLVDGSFELESWMQTTRDRLRHLAIGARQKLVAYYLREGDYSAGIQHAIILLQDDPLDESAHRQMMLLLAKKKFAKKARYGYVNGREPVNYVRDIRQRFEAYIDISGNVASQSVNGGVSRLSMKSFPRKLESCDVYRHGISRSRICTAHIPG